MPTLSTEPAAIIGLIVTFLVGGLTALGANGSIPADVAAALATAIPFLASLILRRIVTSPATATTLAAPAGPADGGA